MSGYIRQQAHNGVSFTNLHTKIVQFTIYNFVKSRIAKAAFERYTVLQPKQTGTDITIAMQHDEPPFF